METKRPATNRKLLIGGAAFLAFACLCLVIAAGIVAIVDPFDLHLLDFLRGESDLAARTMPANTSFYIGLDLVRFDEEDARRISELFINNARQEDIVDIDEIRSDLDAELADALGVTLSDDILPWAGRSLGLGISDLTIDDFGDVVGLEWVLVLATRDRDASDRFLEKLRESITGQSGIEPAINEIEGVTVYDWSSDDDLLERIAIARSDDVVMLGSGTGTIRATIQAQQGNSLADVDEFAGLMSSLPRSRAVTLYVDAGEYGNLLSGLSDELPLPIDPTEQIAVDSRQVGASMSFLGEGVRLDFVSQGGEFAQDQEERQQLEVDDDLVVIERLPADTILFVAGQGLETIWDNARQGIIDGSSEAEFAELMASFDEEFGLNPDSDLFPLLDDDWAIVVMPTSGGILAEEMDISIGIGLLAMTTQSESLRRTVSEFTAELSEGGIDVRPEEVNDGVEYHLVLEPSSESSLDLGVRQETLFIASDHAVAQSLFDDGESLPENETYRQAIDALPGEMTPAFYLNLDGLLAAIEGSAAEEEIDELDEATGLLSPIRALAAGSQSDTERQRTTIVFVVDQE